MCSAQMPPSLPPSTLPQGYGLTLGTINALAVLTSALQAVPNLQIQVLTLITWMVARFFMYSRCACTRKPPARFWRRSPRTLRPPPTHAHPSRAATLRYLARSSGFETLVACWPLTTPSTACSACSRQAGSGARGRQGGERGLHALRGAPLRPTAFTALHPPAHAVPADVRGHSRTGWQLYRHQHCADGGAAAPLCLLLLHVQVGARGAGTDSVRAQRGRRRPWRALSSPPPFSRRWFTPPPPPHCARSPLEGEELPTDPVGPRTRRRVQFLA